MFRNCLLILLVALLPIRSWASESMGFKMVQPNHSMEMIADSDASHCEMMQSGSTDHQSRSEQHDNQTCNVCSLCMAFAFALPTPLMKVNQFSYQFSQREPLFIRSALLALPIKPPIL